MNWFPQVGAGSVTQFPLRRSRTWRAIRNEMESGEQIVLPDAASGQIEWGLTYQDLDDGEATRLRDLFAASQGRFRAFGFVDPLANLLGWSEDLARPDWDSGLLTTTTGASDPLGTQRAWALSNGSAGEQQLTQTVSVPGEYVVCFSAWARADAASALSLRRDGAQTTVAIGPVWKRVFISGAGGGASNSAFSIAIAAGQSLDVWGLQAEAQPYPSQYKTTTVQRGIYEETYFGADELTITSTGVGLSGCGINLLSRV